MGLAAINVKFNVDLKQFSTEMQNSLREIDKFGQKMQSIGRSMSVAITLPVLAAGGAAVKMASDYEESLNKVDVSFKSSSDVVKVFAKTSLQSFGIAEGTALDMSAAFGDMGTSMGLSTGEAAKMSTSLVGLAGDMSSFKNIGIDQANTALSAIFTGETESLKRLGIVMTEANLQQFAYSQGIQTTIQDMDQASKVQLRYNYIMSVTKNSQGDFARTSGGAANQMRIFQETLKQVGQQFGSIILPAFTKLLSGVNVMITAFGNLSEGTKKTIIVIAGIAAAIGPLVFAIGAISSMIPLLSVGFAALMGPIGLVIAGLAAAAFVVIDNWDVVKQYLVDIGNYFIDLYNSSKVFRAGVEAVIFAFKSLWEAVKFVFQASKDYLTFVGKTFVAVFSGIGKIVKAALTLDFGALKAAVKSTLNSLSANGGDFAKKMSDGAKKAFAGMGDAYADAANKAATGRNIKKITIQKNKVDAKGVESAVEEAAKKGAGKPIKIKRPDIEAVGFSGAKGSVAAGSKFDEEIAKLKKFRDEVALTTDQIKAADKAIAQVEFAKAIQFDPSSIIKGNIDGVAEKLAAQAAGMTTSMNMVSITAQKMKENVADAALPALADSFASLGQGVVSALGLAETGFGGFISGLATTITKLVSMMLASSISQSIAGATASGAATGPAAIFTTPAFIATAVGGVIAAFAAIPKFETGGVVGGNSFYGDKILARVNSGELVLNNSQQAKIYGMMNNSSSAASVIIPEVKIKGNDLLIVFDRATNKKNRIG